MSEKESAGRSEVADVVGVVLAAGAGRRMGRPKALLRDPHTDLTFVERAVSDLYAAGLGRIVVVTGADGEEVALVLRPATWSMPFRHRRRRHRVGVFLVEAPDWEEGMGASLRSGLEALDEVASESSAVLVTLVDLPDVGPSVHRRLMDTAHAATRPGGDLRAGLWRAAYEGRPGHPVLLGRDHWAGVWEAARGDRGARDYFADHPPTLVECGDLATGCDVDTPADLAEVEGSAEPE